MTKLTKAAQAEREKAIAELRALLPPGSKVRTILRHVSSSGMTRHISCVVAHDGEVRDITWLVSRAAGYRRHAKDGGLIVGGCGMDMGFQVVYNLGCTLYPKGGSLAKTNGTRRIQAERAGEKIETDGGYLLKQEWV